MKLLTRRQKAASGRGLNYSLISGTRHVLPLQSPVPDSTSKYVLEICRALRQNTLSKVTRCILDSSLHASKYRCIHLKL